MPTSLPSCKSNRRQGKNKYKSTISHTRNLADNLEALFRNVPPPLSLALAMTEKHEKAERAAIMRERNCSELEAVYVIAERIAQNRGG